LYYCYGEVRSQNGGIPAGGGDNSKAWGVFTAGEHPCEIISGTYRSGDAGEFYCLAVVPPSFPTLNGTTTIAGGTQGVQSLTRNLVGGVATAAAPESVYFDVIMKAWIGQNWIIPPFHHVVVFPATAASTNDLYVSLMGMDLVKP